MGRFRTGLSGPSRFRRRIAGTVIALVMALPLLVQPELWQYLTAALLVHDLLLRMGGEGEVDRPALDGEPPPRPEREEEDELSATAPESDAVRTHRNRP